VKYDRMVIAYHGCDAKVAHAIVGGTRSLKASENDYDWLGSGIYFWEFGYDRALKGRRRRGSRSQGSSAHTSSSATASTSSTRATPGSSPTRTAPS